MARTKHPRRPFIFVSTSNPVIIEFDPAKRDKTPGERGLDFGRAFEVFAGTHFIQWRRHSGTLSQAALYHCRHAG
ncbi:protein of unknown function [Cupriavidus neocaledonicus]|uniref:Uncharacterized protein n=1 Tax=Cupriavidus neocaledonicus TaxID=1040979 RepID=A0A375H9B1_9BURK|nr:hypothetical protein CBM2605_A230124 [Cupriavidus neocaledonicus]SPD47835.1 protein of unknown function [Cupriavidus neocaledonicus]